MSVTTRHERLETRDSAKLRLIRLNEYERLRFVPVLDMTPRELRERMRDMGMRAEDNIGSQMIVAIRNSGEAT